VSSALGTFRFDKQPENLCSIHWIQHAQYAIMHAQLANIHTGHSINVQHEKWQPTSDFSETWYTCSRY